jgi:hypothetical protein
MTNSTTGDSFAVAGNTEPPALKSRYVSTRSVGVGEGVRFEVRKLEVVSDRFANDSDAKVIEIEGEILESRSAGLEEHGVVVITCKAVRLEQMGNDIAKNAEVPGAIVTLVRGEDEGKAAGWRWVIE